MSAGLYGSVGGVNRKIKKLYANAGGVNREIKESWAVKDGVNRKIFNSGSKIEYAGALGKIGNGQWYIASNGDLHISFGWVTDGGSNVGMCFKITPPDPITIVIPPNFYYSNVNLVKQLSLKGTSSYSNASIQIYIHQFYSDYTYANMQQAIARINMDVPLSSSATSYVGPLSDIQSYGLNKGDHRTYTYTALPFLYVSALAGQNTTTITDLVIPQESFRLDDGTLIL